MAAEAAPLSVFCRANALTHTSPLHVPDWRVPGSTRRMSPAAQRGESRAPAWGKRHSYADNHNRFSCFLFLFVVLCSCVLSWKYLIWWEHHYISGVNYMLEWMLCFEMCFCLGIFVTCGMDSDAFSPAFCSWPSGWKHSHSIPDQQSRTWQDSQTVDQEICNINDKLLVQCEGAEGNFAVCNKSL